MSAATARAVLTHGALRWSSPLLFNDPFDVPRELAFGLTPQAMQTAIARRVASLISAPPKDTSGLQPYLRLLIDTAKTIDSGVRAEILADLRDAEGSEPPPGQGMADLQAQWKALVPTMRILCLTESPDHVAMWYHYAGRYTGVVLELRCDDALCSAWLAAQPVTYPDEKPGVYTAEGWATILSMPQELAVQALIQIACYTKSRDWSYEREWRLASFALPQEMGLFTDFGFDPKELASVYLGPLISEDDRDHILALLPRYPMAVAYDVAIGFDRELKVQEIGRLTRK